MQCGEQELTSDRNGPFSLGALTIAHALPPVRTIVWPPAAYLNIGIFRTICGWLDSNLSVRSLELTGERWKMEHKDSYGCRGCSDGHSLLDVAWPSAWRAGRPRTAQSLGPAEPGAALAYGPGIRRRWMRLANSHAILVQSCRVAVEHPHRALGMRPEM